MESIPIKNIVLNNWNPNVMDTQTYQALKESFTEFGNIDPILVRDIGDKYQVVDGEHRYKIACDLGLDEIQAIVIDVSDTQAKRLTQIMNRTKGKDDPGKLMNLLDSLLQEMSEDEVVKGLPYSPDKLTNLINDLHKYQDLSDIIPNKEEYEREKLVDSAKKSYKTNLEKLDLSILDDEDEDEDESRIENYESKPKSTVREKLFIGFTVTSTEFGYWENYKESVNIKKDKQAFLYLLGVD